MHRLYLLQSKINISMLGEVSYIIITKHIEINEGRTETDNIIL